MSISIVPKNQVSSQLHCVGPTWLNKARSILRVLKLNATEKLVAVLGAQRNVELDVVLQQVPDVALGVGFAATQFAPNDIGLVEGGTLSQ